MKKKLMILAAAVLAIGSIALTGCGSDNAVSSTTASSETSAVASSETEPVTSDVNSESSEASSPVINLENRGEVVDGIFTSTNGLYTIMIPDGVNLVTATDTTTVFAADEGKTSITVSFEENNGPFKGISEETFTKPFSQLYSEYATTNFETKDVNDKQTNYKLSFTGKDKELPLQVHVFKAITNQKAVTIQVSAAADNDHALTTLETMAATLVF